jgi:hypothetical protein
MLLFKRQIEVGAGDAKSNFSAVDECHEGRGEEGGAVASVRLE